MPNQAPPKGKTSNEKVKIVFTPSGKQGSVAKGLSVLTAARELGVDIDSVCGGRAMCGRCQVVVAEGEFAKHGIHSAKDSVTPPSKVEIRYGEVRAMDKGHRLSCQAALQADAVIDVPATSQTHAQLIRKSVDPRVIQVEAPTRLCYIEVRPPDMHDPTSDLTRVGEALRQQWRERLAPSVLKDQRHITADLHVLTGLQKTLRDGKWCITVALRHGKHITGVWAGFHGRVLGAAIDIGSTTMSVVLCDMNSGEVLAEAGAMNPQIRFGEDLMSRVSYGLMNEGGEVAMTKAVRHGLMQLLADAAKQAGLSSDDIIDIVLVGNPVMHHLMLGIDPRELGGAPFALAVDDGVEVHADTLGFSVHPGARVYVLPCIAGHVGADAAAVALAMRPDQSQETMLIVDVGTNAEIILGNTKRVLAASSPTGPAFEGAEISNGQRAAPGAIERVRIDRDTFAPRFKVIGCDLWSDEDGFADTAPPISGICGSGIIEVLAEMYLSRILTSDGVISPEYAKSPRIEKDKRTYRYRLHDSVAISQNDVRAIQLAKAALYAGARLLMDKLGIDSVDRIVLAGAFGSYIDPKYALVLGMLPDCPLDAVKAVGNAAGTGARICLLNKTARSEVEGLVRRIEKIETAVESDFQTHFVNAMSIPHKTAPYRFLAQAVTLPASNDKAAGGRQRGRRRRQSS